MQTLGELIESFSLYAVCDNCRRTAPLDLEQLVDQLGADYRIEHIRQRLFCSPCQQRSNALRIVYIGPEGRAKSFRYAR